MRTSLPSSLPADGAILIAAQSGRALTAAARRAGLRPFVVDLFGDEDTRALAESYRQAEGRFGFGASARSTLCALDRLAAAAGPRLLGIVLGSGFEHAPALIAAIAARFPLLGASASTVAQLKDPITFAALLAGIGAPHPAISLSAVSDPENWLRKRQGGSGGSHVRQAGAGPPRPGCYLQRRMPGEPISIAFLADGGRAQILATTRQWTAPSPRAPFRYAGAVETGPLPAALMGEIEQAIRSIVSATRLRGLASADCLVAGRTWSLLEINPRPGGTLDLLDRGATPLLQRHIAGCLGEAAKPEARPEGAAATEILYADRGIRTMPRIVWPDFVMDRPAPGSCIAPGSPICTVIAAGRSTAAALDRLRCRAGTVRKMLREEGSAHAEPGLPPERERTRCAAG